MSTLVKSIAEQLKQEHQIIGEAVNALRELVGRPVSPREEQTVWLNSVRDQLFSLGSHLKTHFAFEEFGGFMEEVVGLSPNDCPQIERLKQDHQTILAESERLCKMVSKGLAASIIPQLRRKILHHLEALNRHEHTENGLVQRVLTGDLGTTD
jgi:hemerythrin